jgi:hypothetical protein
MMKRTRWFSRLTCLLLPMLFAAALLASTASSTTHALPPAFGKLCGHVAGASWKFHGQTGTQYNVVGLPAGSCGVAMKMVGALTKQKPHAGALGSQTLSAPGGYSCAGSGKAFAHAGTCGRGTAHFSWAPLLKK